MKKLLLILSILSCFTLFSCDEGTESNTNLPTEINRLRHTSQFDTMLVIKTAEKVYEFDYKTQKFIKSTPCNQVGGYIAACLFGFLFLFFIFIIIILIF